MIRTLLRTALVVQTTASGCSAIGQFEALPDSAAAWIADFYYVGPDVHQIYYYHLEYFDHDTLINDTLYSVLFGYMDGAAWPGTFQGGLYDNGEGQVYYHHPGTSMSYLLYDFDVLVGDSVRVWVGESIEPDANLITMYVDSVDTISIGGILLKRIGIQSEAAIIGGQGIVHWWIQGIGGTGGLLGSSGAEPLDFIGGLACMSADDTVWWAWGPDGSPGSCLTVGIEAVANANSDDWFHPSLVSDEIQLDLPRPVNLVRIFTMDGRLIAQFHPEEDLISISSLPSGGYVLEHIDGLGHMRQGRFLKP